MEFSRYSALLSLTGEWSSLGINSRAALEIAKADIEKYLTSINSKARIDLRIEDTKLDPQTALDKLKLLNLAGYKIVIGPQSSAEILGIKKYADENNMLIISQSSTASDLSVAGDNIFRLCPDDLGEAKAITSLILDDNIKYLIPVYRLDIGNEGLYKSLNDVATKEKLFVSEPITYTDDSENFDNILDKLKIKLNEALSKFPNTQIGVYLAAFDENMEIFREAYKFPELEKVKWYGSDGAALSKVLISNSVASDFAISVDYPCPIFGLENNASEKWMPVKKAIFESTRMEADAFALATYDALWIVYLSQISNGISTFANFKWNLKRYKCNKKFF